MNVFNVQEHVQLLLLLISLEFLAIIFALRLGFFRMPLGKANNQPSNLSFSSVVVVFLIYVLVEMIIIPATASLWVFYEQGHFPKTEEELALPLRTWFNLLAMILGTSSVLLFCSFLGTATWDYIWDRYQKGWKIRINSLALGISTWLLCYPLVASFGQVMALIFSYLYKENPPEMNQVAVNYLRELFERPILFICSSIAIVFLVPIAEEILFRGFLQNWLRKKIGVIWAIFCTSIVFASLHFSPSQGMGNWELLFSLFVLSCFLGYLYERQRSLYAPIGLHATFNAVSIILIAAGG